MKVCVIPGVLVGREVIEPVIPLLREAAPGIDFEVGSVRPVPEGWSRAEEGLRLRAQELKSGGSLDAAAAGRLLEGRSTLAAFKRELLRGGLSPTAERELWDCLALDLSPAARESLRSAEACLLGATGADTGVFLFWLRQGFRLHANVRPVWSFSDPRVDFVIVRENTEGLYSLIEEESDEAATALRVVTRRATEAAARRAAAESRLRVRRGRGGRVTIVHKANVLRATCGLFRRSAQEVLEAEGIFHDEMHVDACALEIARRPERFDVLLTTNLFGDILSDEAAMHMGGLGMAPSACYGDGFALFEPVHGSAPDIAGRGVANPMAALLSSALLLEHLGLPAAAGRLQEAVRGCVLAGETTPDLGGGLGTGQVVDRVAERLRAASGVPA